MRKLLLPVLVALLLSPCLRAETLETEQPQITATIPYVHHHRAGHVVLHVLRVVGRGFAAGAERAGEIAGIAGGVIFVYIPAHILCP